MRKLVFVFCLLLLTVLVSGCIDLKEKHTLNLDGSGKMEFTALLEPVDISMSGEEQDFSKDDMKGMIKQTIEDSKGVDAWSKISYKKMSDGKMLINGALYYKDIGKLGLNIGGISMTNDPVLYKDQNGDLVFEIGIGKRDKSEKKPVVKLSEKEIKAKIKSEKAAYKKSKPMLDMLLGGMKTERKFRLPGTLKSSSNLKRDNEGNLIFAYSGKKILESIEKLSADATWMRNQILAEVDLNNDFPVGAVEFNELVFGEKAPVRAVFSGDFKPLFNYDAEVKKARKDFPQVLKKLGIQKAAQVERIKAGGGIRDLVVNKIEAGKDRYVLGMEGKLPEEGLAAEGKITKIISSSGADLLPESDWDKRLGFLSLSNEDNKTVTFDIRVPVPEGKKVKGVKEISGVLEYTVGVNLKKINLGINSFKAKAKGNKFSAKIEKLKEGESEWSKGSWKLNLFLDLPPKQLRSAEFYDSKGKKLDVSKGGYSAMNDKTTFYFSLDGKFPKKGKIVIETFEKIIKKELSFKLKNISFKAVSRK
ncbi:MAG: hypothetical protein HQ564_07010 [Candidatus Saganbacteria bacterium]|nr:hypothetical protein [Candidatus Saganbacteria bacterium]